MEFYSIIESEDLMVNSLHSNSIDNCPKLNKVAFCEDGYPDAIESKDKDFYIGVRFHYPNSTILCHSLIYEL